MLSVYLVCAILGGVLVLFSAVAGLHGHGDVGDHGGDVDLGHDVDHDVGHDAGDHGGQSDWHKGELVMAAGDTASWLPFTSLRFYLYLLAAFGLVGTILTLTKATAEPLTLVLSAGTGFVTGFLASAIVFWLRRADSNSAVGHDDFMGAIGRVSVPIRTGAPGKLRTTIRGDVIDVIATAAGDEEILASEEVVIVDMVGHTAKVSRTSDVLQEMRQEP